MEYKEIKALKEYCDKIGVIATLKDLFDGYILRFEKGGDCVQHRFSYGSDEKKVEFGGTGSRLDYKATTLDNAKAFVKRNKDKLNKEERNGGRR